MFRVCAALLLAGAALATPVADPTHGGHGKDRDYVQCHVVYDVVHDNHCETYHEEVCHEEYDVVVDTTYIEECADTVTQHCQSHDQQVHHSSAVVGHDSQLIVGGHAAGYEKRSAEPAGYGSAPVCKEHVERQCHQVPQHLERKVPRQVCHSEPRQQCHQSAHKVPRRVCAHYYDDKKNNKDNRKNRGYGYGSDDKKNNKDNKKNRGYGYGYGRY